MAPNYDLRCHCGTIATKRQSNKRNENFGRFFFVCSNQGRCKFFQWADASTKITNAQNFNDQINNQQQIDLNLGRSPVPINQNNSNFQNLISQNNMNNNAFQNFNPNDGNPNQGLMPSTNSNWLQKMHTSKVPVPYCESHKINCRDFEVKKQNANFGRRFYSCPAEKNCFFMWQSEWISQYQNSKPPESLVVTQKGKRFVPSSSLENEGAYFTVKLELTGNIHKDNERILYHLPKSEEIKPKILSILSKYNGYNVEDNNGNTVSLPRIHLESSCEEIKKIDNANVTIDPIPETVLNMISNSVIFDEKDDSHVDWNKFPKTLLNSLKAFQRIGISFGIKKNGICLISDEMGLGKTIQSIAISFYFRESWPLLIICPSSLRMNWSTELEKWLVPYLNPSDISIVNKSSDLKNQKHNFQITIISYELASKNIELLISKNFQFIIADESHYLKSEDSQRTKTIVPLMKNSKRRIMITGTPALSRPKELYPQIEALFDSNFLTSFEYKKRYCAAILGQFGLDDNGSSNLKELNYLLKKTIMIRREKKHVLTELPEKLRVQLTVEVSKQHKKNIKKLNTKILNSSGSQGFAKSFEELQDMESRKNQDWMSMFRMTAEAKISAVSFYVSERLKHSEGKNGKFIIFGHHQVMLDAIEEVTKKELKRGSYIRIDGKTPNHQRQSLVDKFTDEESCKIAILSIQAAGTGLNFTPCNQVVFAELFWTPAALKQAEDRVHRLNQRSDVHITYIIGKDTLDEKIWPLILRKLEVLSKSLDMQEEDKELWKKSKDWGQSSTLLEMFEKKNIEEKIVKEDGMRSVAKEYEIHQKSNFQPIINELDQKRNLRKQNFALTLETITLSLNRLTYCEDGDLPAPNQIQTFYQNAQISSTQLSIEDLEILDDILFEDPPELGKRKRDEMENNGIEPISTIVIEDLDSNHSLSIDSNNPLKVDSTIKKFNTNKKISKESQFKDLGKMFEDMNRKVITSQKSSQESPRKRMKRNPPVTDQSNFLQINPIYEQLIDNLLYQGPTKISEENLKSNQQKAIPRLATEDDILDFI